MTAGPIRAPRWSQPVFAAPDEALTVVVDAPKTTEVAFCLSIEGREVALEVQAVEAAPEAGVVLYRVGLPDDVEEGLADLKFVENGVCYTMPRAVAVYASPPSCVRLVYTSDWHLLRVTGDAPPVDQAQMFFELAHHLNDLAPDAVVHTGDVFTRYQYPGGPPLSEQEIRRQMMQAMEIFDLLRMPVFVLPGNHDVAYETCRRVWWETVGRPWKKSTDDASRILGPCHLLLVDGFVHYDPQTYCMTVRSLTSEQMAWFEDALARTGDRWRILALHYDYSEQILPRLQELGIDLFFYGHSKGKDPDFFELSGARDGHLPGGAAYRLAEVTTDSLDLGPSVGFADVGIERVG